MQTQAMQEHIRQVFQDEDFVRGLFDLATPQEVKVALAQKNIELTVEEIVQVREQIVKHIESDRELSDIELSQVQGGSTLLLVGLVAAFLIGGAVLGGIAAAGSVGGAYIVDQKTGGQW